MKRALAAVPARPSSWDPVEVTDIAWPDYPRTPEQREQADRLKLKLQAVKATRLQLSNHSFLLPGH